MVIPGLHRRVEVNTTYNNNAQPIYNVEPKTNFLTSSTTSARTKAHILPTEIRVKNKTTSPLNFSSISSGNEASDVSTSFHRDNYNPVKPTPPQAVTSMGTLNYHELYNECMKLHKENSILKNNVTPARRRKVRRQHKNDKNSTMFEQQFPSICKAIARNHIWKYVKYISDESMLESYIDPKSIGYKFFKYYKNENENEKILEKQAEIWEEAKDYVYEAIAAKRNAIQTKIKNCFKGRSVVICFYFSYVYLH